MRRLYRAKDVLCRRQFVPRLLRALQDLFLRGAFCFRKNFVRSIVYSIVVLLVFRCDFGTVEEDYTLQYTGTEHVILFAIR